MRLRGNKAEGGGEGTEPRSFAVCCGTRLWREAAGAPRFGARFAGSGRGPVGRRFRFRWGRGGGRGAGPRARSVRGASGRRWDPQNKGRGGSGAGRPQAGRAEAGGGRAGPGRAGPRRRRPGGGRGSRAGPGAEERRARRPGRGAMAAAETKIIYHLDEQETPYLVKLPIPAERVTLGDFKGLLNRPNYKFYFKSMDDDFG